LRKLYQRDLGLQPQRGGFGVVSTNKSQGLYKGKKRKGYIATTFEPKEDRISCSCKEQNKETNKSWPTQLITPSPGAPSSTEKEITVEN
jgi:hypothetical protein